MNIEGTVKAVLISPWASLLIVIFVFGDDLLRMKPEQFEQMLTQIPGTLIVLTMFVLGFVGTSYLLVLFAGLPLHLLLSKLNITHWSAYVGSGLAIGLLFQYIQYFGSDMPKQLQEAGYISYAICSLLVSFSFWHIAVNSHNQAFKRTI